MRKKKIILVILIGAIVSGIVLLYSSYALFSANQISKSAITIKAGTMNGTIKVDGTTNNKLTLVKGAKQTFVVTLENLNAIDGKFIPYYSGTIPDGVTFGYMEATGIDLPVETTLSKNGKKTYSIYLENNSTSSVTITLGVQGGLSNQPLSLPSNGNMIPQAVKKNTNISNIWKYDQTTGSSTFCVTGEESTCLPINPETFEPGTIIKYKVNDTTEKYFHVISDDGDTLTMQQRENTVEQTKWYDVSDDNTKGPITALSVIEDTTKNWTNVLEQTYTLGTTVFKDNAFTGCSYDEMNKVYNCTKNAYVLGQRTAKARLISLQEAKSLGCIQRGFGICPIWMYNYLGSSTSYGGTVNQGTNYAYWLISADSLTRAWHLNYNGAMSSSTTTNTHGARAVVKINKTQAMTPANNNITHVYQYDSVKSSSTFCITGEDSTCKEIGPQDTYTAGTIIKYKVNDNLEKYFHVISDNGDTLTMQQREETVYNTRWYGSSTDNSKGPITLLEALENATSSWTNVLNQIYTLGSTVFKDNAFTGCSYDETKQKFNCTTNTYALSTRTSKVRIISLQEAIALGCTKTINSCPTWMSNYLTESTKYGGTENRTGGDYGMNYSYWTLNANASTSIAIWQIRYDRTISESYTSSSGYSGRAVVMIQK